MASTTALPPPTSISRQGTGHFVCWLFAARPVPVVHLPATSSTGCLLRGLCRPLHLLAVCYEACAGHFICRLFATTALFCHAMPCLPASAMAPCLLPLFHFCPCSVLHSPPPPVHYHVRQDHRASCRDCPVGSRNTGLHWRPVHRFCSLCSFQKGEALDCA